MDCESGADQSDHAVFLDEEDYEADCGGNDEIAEEGTLFVADITLISYLAAEKVIPLQHD